MDGDVKKTNQIQIPKFIFPEAVNGADYIPVELCGRLVSPSVAINELGKQLLRASIDGNVDDIKMLMSKGAPFTADWLGTNPLHFAAQNNHLEVCEILLRAGISKDARTKVDRTPLHIAVYEGNIEIVKCLLNNKADVDCKDLLCMTPLHWAAQNCHAEITELLVRQGAQTDVINKFNLTALDIALQCERQDIAEIINMTIHDPEIAAQNLTIEMNEMDNDNEIISCGAGSFNTEPNAATIPIETVYLEEDSENSIDPERLQINHDMSDTTIMHTYAEEPSEEQSVESIEETTEQVDNNNKFSESIKILQEHGITMLPADDDTNILSSILESGHSVVLTEVGKQVLNSTKPFESSAKNVTKIAPKIKTFPTPIKPKKVITVTPQEFLAMTLNQGDIIKQVNRKLITNAKPNVRRIVMKKNKVGPVTTNVCKPQNEERISDIELLMRQLIDARRLIEEYKQKLLKKEAEAEKYKQQLLLITQSKNNLLTK